MHDLSHMLPTQLLRMRELIMVRFRAVLHTENITDAQWRALRVLNELGSVDFSTLAELSIIAKPSLSRVVTNLEGRGLVQRAGNNDDHRQVVLSLTGTGRAFVDSLAPRIAATYAGLVDDLGEDRMEQVFALVAESITALQGVRSTHHKS